MPARTLDWLGETLPKEFSLTVIAEDQPRMQSKVRNTHVEIVDSIERNVLTRWYL